MVVACEQVWLEISNYIENDLDPTLKNAMDEHIHGCPQCASVLAGTRNIVQLYGDERLVQVPLGFSSRLHKRISKEMPDKRGTIYGWVLAVAAVALIAGGLTLVKPKAPPLIVQQSPLAKPGSRIPANLKVVVSERSRIFHIAGCDHVRAGDGELRSLTAEQAEHEGLVPCVRCLGKYLKDVATDFMRKRLSSSVAA